MSTACRPYLSTLAIVIFHSATNAHAQADIADLIAKDRCEPQLSINWFVQPVLERELTQAAKKFRSPAGWALVSDIRTGAILAHSKVGKAFDRSRPPSSAKVLEPELKLLSIAAGLDAGAFDLTTRIDLRESTKSLSDDPSMDRWMTVQQIYIVSTSPGIVRILQSKKAILSSALHDMAARAERVSRETKTSTQSEFSDLPTVSVGYGFRLPLIEALALTAATVNGGRFAPLVSDLPLPAECNSSPPYSLLRPTTSFEMRSLLKLNGEIGSVKKANRTTSAVLLGGESGIISGAHNMGINFFLGAFPIAEPEYQLFIGLVDPKAAPDTFGFSSPSWNVVPVAGSIAVQLGLLLHKTSPAGSTDPP